MANIMFSVVFIVSMCIVSQAATDTSFDLYTYESGPERLTFDDTQSMLSSHFNVCAKTIVLITGLNADSGDPELLDGAKTIAAEYFNAIVVNYDTSQYLTNLLENAADIARFVEAMVMNLNASRSQFTLMGISYGAHVAGMASQLYRLNRIIGVDPSGPVYDLLPHEIRLDYHDADLVEIIHSSNDIYCHHVRAARFFLAAVKECEVYFQRCPSYVAFKLGWCRRFPMLLMNPSPDPDEIPKDRGVYFYDHEMEEYPFCSRSTLWWIHTEVVQVKNRQDACRLKT